MHNVSRCQPHMHNVSPTAGSQAAGSPRQGPAGVEDQAIKVGVVRAALDVRAGGHALHHVHAVCTRVVMRLLCRANHVRVQ